ncbi:MAG TPA: hypothetical protein VF798_11870 [Burkholderiaceae bacterium]
MGVLFFPAYQRLDAADSPGLQIDDGLIEQMKLFAGDCRAQGFGNLPALFDLAYQLGGKELALPRSDFPGLLEREIGALEQAARIVCIRRKVRDSDTAAQIDLLLRHKQRFADCAADAFAVLRDVFPAAGVAQENREFVATQPSQQRGRAEKIAQALGDLIENRVACELAEDAVDPPELVETDENQGSVVGGGGDRRKRAFEATLKCLSRKQAARRIPVGIISINGCRLGGELLFGKLPFH